MLHFSPFFFPFFPINNAKYNVEYTCTQGYIMKMTYKKYKTKSQYKYKSIIITMIMIGYHVNATIFQPLQRSFTSILSFNY